MGVGLATPALAQNASDEIVVTAQRREEAIQDVPIAVSAFNAEALQSRGLDGGADLLQVIPNVNFSKGNFTGYNFQIRGVGAKVVAAGADAGVGVHQNGAPFIANRLFEAEFYDVQRVEVLRGPQGTLYGRNATGGVINVITNLPTDELEFSLRAEGASFGTFRGTAVANIPIIGDNVLGLRLAGTTIQRSGFGYNTVTDNEVDDRNIFAGRATLAFNPSDNFSAWLLYEHFEEDDSRARVGRQLCRHDPGPADIGGLALVNPITRGWFSQGCTDGSLYGGPEVRGGPNSLATLGGSWAAIVGLLSGDVNAGVTQSEDPRIIESGIDPIYTAEANVVQLNMTWDISDSLRLVSLTSYNDDTYFTFQDYFRFQSPIGFNFIPGLTSPAGVFNDPQLGSTNLLRTFDISSSEATQWTQELRLESSFDGPFNFNVGAIWLQLESLADYWVFGNALTAAQLALPGLIGDGALSVDFSNPPSGDGHNYYLNRSWYDLDALGVFGEVYWEPIEDFTITAGVRHTSDTKDVQPVNPALFTPGFGLVFADPQHVEFNEITGRIGFDWRFETPFTDSTLLYAFYSRGYKSGGFNPPASVGVAGIPLAFEPEFVDAIEVGIKNTLFDGRMILNLTAFHYDYQGYQVSRIVNRSSVNENIDATVDGFEVELGWEVFDGFRLDAALGWLSTEIEQGVSLDTLNRTQGDPTLTLLHDPFSGQNCTVPTAVLTDPNGAGVGVSIIDLFNAVPLAIGGICSDDTHFLSGVVSEGVEVDLAGRALPNSPEWTLSLGAQYSWALGGGWEATARADYYWQDDSYSRIYNSPSDLLEGYSNLNLLFRLANEDWGTTVEAFVTNATDELAYTDAYLTDDTSGLFRNTFLTDPRIFGLRIQQEF
ncbi:MAG: TonB-dependent receptor [Hyphomonadaceae bacterium]